MIKEAITLLIDGQSLTMEQASEVMEELTTWTGKLKEKGISPTIALVLVGDDRYSRRYVRMKVRRAEKVGMVAQLHHLVPELLGITLFIVFQLSDQRRRTLFF